MLECLELTLLRGCCAYAGIPGARVVAKARDVSRGSGSACCVHRRNAHLGVLNPYNCSPNWMGGWRINLCMIVPNLASKHLALLIPGSDFFGE